MSLATRVSTEVLYSLVGVLIKWGRKQKSFLFNLFHQLIHYEYEVWSHFIKLLPSISRK